jgi:hypothetical protein
MMADNKKGLYDKYIVTKANGQPTDPKADYFVLRLDRDKHALRALEEYIYAISYDNKRLADELWKKLEYYKNK